MTHMSNRQHCRLPVDIDGYAILPDSGTVVQCRVRDISLGGAYLTVDRSRDPCDLRVSQTLELHLWGIGRLSAQVVYKGRDGVGVRFRNDHRAQAALAERLGDLMMRQLRVWERSKQEGAQTQAAPPPQAQSGDGSPDADEPREQAPGLADEDRRAAPRRRLFRRGKIIFNDRNCTMACVILDISEGGACIEPLDTAYLPEEFALKVGNWLAQSCEVVWRSGEILGVRFLGLAGVSADRAQHGLALRQ